MIYGLLAVVVAALIATTLTVRWALSTVENTQLLAAQERDALTAAHMAQLAEFANRIQQPDRASHVSISEFAPPSEPFVHPDLEEEAELIGET